MQSFDDAPLQELNKIVINLNKDSIGDSFIRALSLRSIILSPVLKTKADEIIDTIREFTRNADIDWKIFEKPIYLKDTLIETQIWQLMAIVGTLREFNYSFERIEEASFATFDNSAPVRFYVNGIFHYLTALFLLDFKGNNKEGFSRPGTLIKVLQPLSLENLLNPIYEVFDKPFGKEMTYGQAILSVRNKGFVHGSFSPENIEKTIKDTYIFTGEQKFRFMQYHFELFDRIIILRLQLTSILSNENINFHDFPPAKLFHL